jgi:hypothetical protein
MGLDTKTYWLTDRQSQCDFDFWLEGEMSRVKWRVEFRDASLQEYKLGSRGIELSRVFEIDSRRIIARKELDSEEKTLCVIWSYSETVINLLPGYD